MNNMNISTSDLELMNPFEFRKMVRRGQWTDMTIDACRNYGQANLVILPEEYAFEFLLFCNHNPHPCYLLDVTESGDPHPKQMAPDADLRTDLPKYRIFRDGLIVDEPTDIINYWNDSLVAFLIGCSWAFIWSFKAANVTFRSLGDYTTNIPLIPAGRFHGNMVCSCRAFPTSHDAVRAIQISSRHVAFHGPPVHIGEPTIIGVKNIGKPDAFVPPWPTPLPEPHEIVMFWGCGTTPQAVALEIKVPFMITHCPGYMFVTDRLTEELAFF